MFTKHATWKIAGEYFLRLLQLWNEALLKTHLEDKEKTSFPKSRSQ